MCQEWIERTLQAAGMQVVRAASLPTVYGADKLLGQLDVCQHKLDMAGAAVSTAVRAGLEARVAELSAAIRADPELAVGLCFGQDWVVEARWSEPPT